MPYGSRETQTGRKSLGLARWLSLGGGVEGGGFDELPSVDITEPEGPTTSGAPMMPQAKFNPGKYNPATAKSGMADFFRGGADSEAANRMNFAAQSELARIAAEQAMAQYNAMTNYANTQLRNSGELSVEDLRGKNELNRIHESSDANFANASGLRYTQAGNLEQATGKSRLTQLQLESEHNAEFAGTPEGIEAQRRGYIATQLAPVAKNISLAAKNVAPNSNLVVPPNVTDVGVGEIIPGPRVSEIVNNVQKPIFDDKGKVIATPSEIKTTRQVDEATKPFSIISDDENNRRVEAARKLIQQKAMQRAGMESNEGSPYIGTNAAPVVRSKPVAPLGVGANAPAGRLSPEQLRALVGIILAQ